MNTANPAAATPAASAPPVPPATVPGIEPLDWRVIDHNWTPAARGKPPRVNAPALVMIVRDAAEVPAAYAALCERDRTGVLYPYIFVRAAVVKAFEAHVAAVNPDDDTFGGRFFPFSLDHPDGFGWDLLLHDGAGSLADAAFFSAGGRAFSERRALPGLRGAVTATIKLVRDRVDRDQTPPSVDDVLARLAADGITDAPAPKAAPEPRTVAHRRKKPTDYGKRITAFARKFRKEHNRGPSKTEIAEGVKGQYQRLLQEIDGLVAEGVLNEVAGAPPSFVLATE
jgi:hypothetical protein